MVITVLKTTYNKKKPREIIYRSYKNFNQRKFKNELKNGLHDNIIEYKDFEKIFLKVLENHAPLKKKNCESQSSPLYDKAVKKSYNEEIGIRNQIS